MSEAFWTEGNHTVSYSQFLNDLNSGTPCISVYGYCYFFELVKSLVGHMSFDNISQLISYISKNKEKLSFKMNTSGTTGNPKLVNLSLRNVLRHVKKVSDNNVWAFAYNPNHFAGTQVFFQAFLNQHHMVYCFLNDFEEIYKLLKTYNVTHISCTPTYLKMLIPYIVEPLFLESITVGGERLVEKDFKLINKNFSSNKFKNIYASTEVGSILSSDGIYFQIPERLQDIVKINADKEIMFHESLLNKSENIVLIDGWYCSGDIIEYIDEKQFKFVNRKSDYIKTGGYRVNPIEIEELVKSLESVQDAVVYGKENSLIGHIICMDVVAKNLTKGDIVSILKQKVESYKIPKIIKFVEKLEMTRTGKVKRI